MSTRSTIGRASPLLAGLLLLAGSGAASPVAALSTAPADVCLLDGTDDRCEKWAATYDDEELYAEGASASDSLLAMAVSPTGDRIFTLGQSGNQQDERWAIVGTNAASGDELWVVRRSAVGVSLRDIAVSADGSRVYVTGGMDVLERAGDGSTLANTNVLTSAYEAATGKLLWEQSFGGFPVGQGSGQAYELHSEEAGVGVAASPTENTVYVTGYRDRPETFYDVLVIAYHGSTGARRWVSHHDRSSADNPYANDKALAGLAAVDPGGNRLFLGAAACTMMRFDPCSFLTAGIRTSDGAMRWTGKVGPAPANNAPTGLEASPDGSLLYLIGGRDDSGAQIVAAYETGTGSLAWAAPFAGTPRSLAVAGDVVAATGVLNGGYGTVAFDAATGETRWTTTQGLTQSRGVSVSPDGDRVYTVGQSGAPLGVQTTIAYDAATGARVWVAQYRRDLDSGIGELISVGPDGTVYSAGQVTPRLGQGNSSDWAITAYEA